MVYLSETIKVVETYSFYNAKSTFSVRNGPLQDPPQIIVTHLERLDQKCYKGPPPPQKRILNYFQTYEKITKFLDLSPRPPPNYQAPPN